MSVVGFDIGNDNCVIAIVKPKAIQILQNDVSKYETPSVVSFTKDRRQIGSAGASSAGMYPMSTISQIKRLIGQNYDDPGMAEEFKLLPFKTIKGPDGGILIEIEYLKETEVFTPVEILAMLLSHLKQMTERNGDGTPVADCVIGIPSYFNDFQRVAYVNAAEIAGLKPLRLIHDGTATAISYGYYNTDIDKPTNVIFVDVGHCDTQVTLAQFDNKKVTILTHASNRNLGGRDFDRILYKYFAEKFKEDYKIDIDVDDNNSHHKARIRLMTACEQAKKVLTANREANISVDCFFDKDLVGSIKREDFENLSKDLLERVVKTCDDALMDVDGKLIKSDIHFVELVGSGSRIPAIGSLIGKFFGKPPNRTLNGSECVARGCALQGVILRSNNNRGYAYVVQDSIPFSIRFILRQKSSKVVQNQRKQNSEKTEYKDFSKAIKNSHINASDRNLPRRESSWAIESGAMLDQFSEIKGSTVLFQKSKLFPCSLHHCIPNASQDFILSSFYEYQGAFQPYTSQRSTHFKVDTFQMDRNVPCSVTVEISIDPNGIIVILSAKKEKQGLFDKWVFPYGKSLEHIKFHEISPFGLTQERIYNTKERAKRLLQRDELVEEVQHQKNVLETCFYDTQNKLKGRYKSFAKVLEKKQISQNLVKAENLINDGDHDIQTYLTRLHSLQQLVDPIESRCKHHEECAQAIKELQNSINNQKTSASRDFSYCSCIEELQSATKQLLRILPKDIEQLPMLVEKIKRITNMINESNHLPEDVSTIREKYLNLFREATRDTLSAHHADKLKRPVNVLEEGDNVEEARGQAVARLLYTIFDSRAERIYLKCFGITGNMQFDNLQQMVINTCNAIEKYCEEKKPQDFPSDDIKCMQKDLDGLRQEMQSYFVFVETHAQASKNSGKLNPQGPIMKEATVTHAAEDEISDLEKQLFGRYRYFIRSEEEKSIIEIIQYLHQQRPSGKRLQLKPHLTSVLDSIKKRYEEYKNVRVQAVGEFYECIFEIRLTTLSLPNNVIKSEVCKRCDDMEKLLDQTFPKPRSRWMDLDDKPWSSEIGKRIETFKMECQSLMQKIQCRDANA